LTRLPQARYLPAIMSPRFKRTKKMKTPAPAALERAREG
jgi:hypothetical protein